MAPRGLGGAGRTYVCPAKMAATTRAPPGLVSSCVSFCRLPCPTTAPSPASGEQDMCFLVVHTRILGALSREENTRMIFVHPVLQTVLIGLELNTICLFRRCLIESGTLMRDLVVDHLDPPGITCGQLSREPFYVDSVIFHGGLPGSQRVRCNTLDILERVSHQHQVDRL